MTEIQEFPGYYVTKDGRVYSKKGLKKRELKQSTQTGGYKFVVLYRDKKRNSMLVHRLVAMSFLDNEKEYKVINHKNGIKTDNNINNLEWCSHSQNSKHAYRTGLNENILRSLRNRAGGNHPMARKVIDVKTNKIYNTMKEAAIDNGLSTPMLNKYLNGSVKNTTSLRIFV